MNVLFTFDVEVWCNSWATLDADFPTSFERYIFGRSSTGDYALPRTLETLNKYDLQGTFFVEPLFAARFGVEYLAIIVKLIQEAGQEIQLHLHPEWTDEATQPLLPGNFGKRQLLSDYSAEEQRLLIGHGLRLLQEAGCTPPIAFRSGSFACNEDTFSAVTANGLAFDSSINPEMSVSQPGGVASSEAGYCEPFRVDGLNLIPMSSFCDGFGRFRHAQVGACSAAELTEALTGARENNWSSFVLLSHNFELMVPDKLMPDRFIIRRFERLCRFLSDNRSSLPTIGFGDLPPAPEPRGLPPPSVTKAATATRYLEQGMRRLSQ